LKAKDDYKENVCFATILALQDTKSSIGDKHHSDDCRTRGVRKYISSILTITVLA